VFLYEDESHIRDYQALRSTWSVKGKQKQIPTYGHHAAVSLYGCVNIQNGEFLCMETNQCNAQTFLAFLRYVLDQHEDQHIVMILDNARIHHAKLIQPFLEENERRLTLLFFTALLAKLECRRAYLGLVERQCHRQSISCHKKRNPTIRSLLHGIFGQLP
jgi:hypothetical protein